MSIEVNEIQVAGPVVTPPSTGKHHGEKRPYVKIRPPGRFSALALGELWQHRDLFWALAVRDLKVRYKQTALGVIWVVLQPLMGALIFTFVFGYLAKVPSDDVPYILFAFAGMVGWQVFNSTLTKASDCIVGNSQLVSKVYFPRLVLPLSTVLSTMIDTAVGLGMMGVLLLVYGVRPGIGIVMFPVALLLLIILAVGMGLFTSAMMVTYRDLRHVVPVFVQFLMYGSPVGYPLSLVQDKLNHHPILQMLYFGNPLVELLEVFRWSLLGKGVVRWDWFGYSVAVVVGVFVFGAFAFKRMERRFADVI